MTKCYLRILFLNPVRTNLMIESIKTSLVYAPKRCIIGYPKRLRLS